MKYKFPEIVDEMGFGEDIDLDVDFQKLYDFVMSVNWSKSSIETNLDVIKEFEKHHITYIVECFDLCLLMGQRKYNNNAINEIRKDFAEWIKNKNQ